MAAPERAYFFGAGSATTIAIASPFGDTASLDIAPNCCGAPSKTSVQTLSPRVHDKTLVPAVIRIVLPSGIHAMSRSLLPSTAFVSVSIFFVAMSIC